MNLIDELYQRDGWVQKAREHGTSPVFVRMQNVADYYYVGTPQEEWNVGSDFPNLAPCWPLWLATWRTPRDINSNGKLIPFDNPGAETAVLVSASEFMPEARPLRWVLNLLFEQRMTKQPGDVGLSGWAWIAVTDDGRFFNSQDFPHHQRSLDDYLTSFLGLDKTNQRQVWLSPIPTMIFVRRHNTLTLPPAGRIAQGLTDALLGNMKPALLGLSLAHCRNVAAVAAEIPAALRKRRAERGHAPIDKWYTLEIGQIKTILRNAREPDGSTPRTLQRALSICRGHFKTFSEHGLFGRYKGTFWWNMHVRGSAEAGIVRKDYSIRGDQP